MSLSTPHITAEQLFEMPDDDGLRRELVQGKIVSAALAGFAEGVVSANVCARLWSHVRRQRLGMTVAGGTGFILARNPDSVRAPDAAFVCAARIARTGIPQFYFPGPPDLAVEILSLGDRPSEVEAKVQDWLSHGTLTVWVIDPSYRTVAVHRSPSEVCELGENDFLEAPDLLPGLRLALAEILPAGVV